MGWSGEQTWFQPLFKPLLDFWLAANHPGSLVCGDALTPSEGLGVANQGSITIVLI